MTCHPTSTLGFTKSASAPAATRTRDQARSLGKVHSTEAPSANPVSGATLEFEDRAQWRLWLEAHHATELEAPLLISKKGTPRGIHYEEALEEALCFGWIDGKLRAHDAQRFVLRFTPRRPESIWSVSNRNRVEILVRAGRMTPAGLAAIKAAKTSGAWEDARRPSDVPRMPHDLRNALQAEPAAWSHFRAWGRSLRAACILWVTGAKRPETRRRRIRRVVWRASRDLRPDINGF